MAGFWLLLVLGLAIWTWYDSLRAREFATRIAFETCTRQNLQLLDSTVALQHLRFRRNPDGRLGLQRAYQFEYSADGATRQRGFIILTGRQVQSIGLAAPRETNIKDIPDRQ
jgi:hypothetical protein